MIGYWKGKSVDEKWRIYIPSKVRKNFDNSLFLTLGEEKIVVILKEKNLDKYCIEVPIDSQDRITIPNIFRDSNSFFFEKKVDLVGFQDRLEIWPSP